MAKLPCDEVTGNLRISAQCGSIASNNSYWYTVLPWFCRNFQLTSFKIMNMWETLTYIGACTVAYCLFKLILVIHHNWKVYFAVTYPDFSKFGKWSG